MRVVKKSRAMGLSVLNWPMNYTQPPWKECSLENMYERFLRDYLVDCKDIHYWRNERERQIRYTLSWRRPWQREIISEARQLGSGGFANPEEVAKDYYRRLLFHLHKWG